MQAESVYGNDPPAQPRGRTRARRAACSPTTRAAARSLNTAYGGTTPYSHLNGGLKRFRVAKAKNGKWMNTWMAADEASWINDTDYDAIAARPAHFAPAARAIRIRRPSATSCSR